MADDATVEVYERQAEAWVAARHRQDDEDVAWVSRERGPGPVIDVGCGPGWNLPGLAPARIGLDAAAAMLDLTGERCPGTPRVLAAAERLPFGRGRLGGAVVNRVLLHLPRVDVPLALGDLHRALAPDAPAFVRVLAQTDGRDLRARGEFAGRLFSTWGPGEFERLCLGAGFEVLTVDRESRPDDRPADLAVRLRRSVTLADTVGPDLRLLICGLNPSPYSAEVGVGFGRPGNRFWPAARAAGLVTVTENDPTAALVVDGLGMTDLVKRPTRRAAELAAEEYRDGLERVEQLVTWLRPDAICFVGLAGWRPRSTVGPPPVSSPRRSAAGRSI